MSDPKIPSPGAELRAPWSRSDRPIPRRIVRPLQSFLQTEAAGGAVLLAAALAAIVWANGPWRATYEEVWGTSLTVGLGRWAITETLRGWIVEGLMSLFFLVVALEIKRELLTGELRDRRAATLPIVAAACGMALPAVIYLALNPHPPASRGWGMVMPTDIAFALGVLGLVSKRLPPGLTVFLLALAIVDDLGSIVVVALFYSTGVNRASLAAAAILAVLIGLLRRVHVRAAAAYLALGAGMWLALHGSGVSPTLAGVVVGFLTPATAFQRPAAVSREAHRVADETVDEPEPPDADAAQWLYLAELSREAVSPLARLESLLHPISSFVILPLFALSSAGVVIGAGALTTPTGRSVALGIVVARLLGKTIGITGAVLLSVRLGLAKLPTGVSTRQVVGVAAAAGIPFTVSIFVAELALPSGLLEAAKIGVLAAALLAGAIAYVLLRFPGSPPGSRQPAVDARGFPI
jgi:NhaA family Na+:H+ antiporter